MIAPCCRDRADAGWGQDAFDARRPHVSTAQGGIGPAGLATEDLHVLDFTDPERPRWHRWEA